MASKLTVFNGGSTPVVTQDRTVITIDPDTAAEVTETDHVLALIAAGHLVVVEPVVDKSAEPKSK